MLTLYTYAPKLGVSKGQRKGVDWMANVLIVYYSAYGHVYRLAEACAEGAARTGATVRVVRVPEMDAPENRITFLDRPLPGQPRSALAERFQTHKRFEKYEAALGLQNSVPLATSDDLRWADGVLWGFPTYYGMMPSQVKLFLEMAGDVSSEGALEGKPAGVFTSAGSIHTGHEASILTTIVPLLHFGMIFVGLPYSENPEFLTADPIGCSPYGASTLAGPDSSLVPEERELLMTSRLGERVAKVAAALRSQL